MSTISLATVRLMVCGFPIAETAPAEDVAAIVSVDVLDDDAMFAVTIMLHQKCELSGELRRTSRASLQYFSKARPKSGGFVALYAK